MAHQYSGARPSTQPAVVVPLPQIVYNVYPPHPWASAALQGLHLVLLGAAINYLGAPGGGGEAAAAAGAVAAAAAASTPLKEQAARQTRRRR